jgi:16S rRNA (guanine966-N2)-methyltransferase
MRIIAGEFRRRLIATPKDASVTRPIPDRVKESLFGLLRGHCEGAHVFDGFAGTGAIGLEAVSRGAARCLFVERDRGIAQLLRSNVETLECSDRCMVLQGDALGAAALASAPRPLTLAFLDPPYPLMLEPGSFARVMAQVRALVGLLTPEGFVVLRTPWPLQHEVVETGTEMILPDPAAPPPTPIREMSRKDKRSRVKKERSWRRHAASMDPKRAKEHLGKPEPAAEELDEIDAKLAAAEAELMQPVRRKVEVDLTLPGIVGPETHVYHSMAVHLYGRKPE